jgi:hypothetical protein
MRKIAVVGLLLTAAVALGCGAANGGDNATGSGTSASSGKSETKTPKTAKIGQPARDGKFEFTVQKVKCGVNEVGPSGFGQHAQGQFCLITLKVANIGKEAQSFSDSDQKAFSSDGTQFSSDSGAAIYVNKDADTLFNQINPGNNITGVIVFDIPKAAKLTKLELHDSPFSGGVTVQLT